MKDINRWTVNTLVMPPALNPMQHMAQEKPEETVNKRKALRWLDIAKYCIIISNGFV